MPHRTTDSPALRREDLPRLVLRVLRPATRVKPALLLVRAAERRLVVKDFSPAAWLVRRECRIYARLAGVEGVPAFRGRLDPFAFAVDHVDGATLKAVPGRDVPPDTFERLRAVFGRIHGRGVVHLDSHQKTNIMLSPDGRVHLLDFATALYLGRGWLARRVLVPLLGRPDSWGVLKLKARYCPDALTAAERRRLRRAEALAWFWPPQWFRWLAKCLRRPRRRR